MKAIGSFGLKNASLMAMCSRHCRYSRCSKRRLDEVLNAVRYPRRNHEVIWFVGAQHQFHGFDVVSGESPVSARIQIAEHERFTRSCGDPRSRLGDLSSDERIRAAGGFVIVKNRGRDKLAVADGPRAPSREQTPSRLRKATRG